MYYDRHGELKNISDARLLNDIQNGYLNYETIFYKRFKAEVDFNGDSKSFKGNIFVRRDSSIIISINPLMGIELFRVRLTNDKVEILDRTKRDYLIGDYDFIWNKFMLEVDFKTIHSILTNELFVYPLDKDILNGLKKYKHNISEDAYVFQSLKEGRAARLERRGVRKDLILHEFYIMPEVSKIKSTYIKDFNSNGSVTIQYGSFYEVNDGLFPGSLTIKGSKGLKTFKIDLKFDDVEFDSDNSIGFRISDKYSKKTIE
ncbi:DUF4292 domain-containing protein [Carboxylicivirga linearis]|uniref:DUF4292 domain-containing protein n=1 Tax=Carboxylicivirga linearis TaxID=1628157 RepID=A0ABS5JVD0_9BACT|nr:DUF4292 domain-containing protein [Carboxylicivirga linearis]MBS2098847.1 DUF4292 domain-containing protein [Carboxylicivirga linearis]